jgi:drug/metabolite transporter (DMT)-like permease
MHAASKNTGIYIMIFTMFIFAMQDGISQHLAGEYNVFMIVMIRYWFFASFVLILSSRSKGGIRAAARSAQPKLQFFRGALLAVEVVVMVVGFVKLGLVEGNAIFGTYPLIVMALSGPLLGERVGWRRWFSVAIGFVGVLVILQPGSGLMSAAAIYPVIAAVMFGVYGILNRYVARKDPASVSFFYNGISGALVMTCVGIWFIEPMQPQDWIWMLVLCCTSSLGHYLLIRAYEISEASVIQPFSYLHLVFGSMLGVFVFGEALRTNVVIGTAIVVAAGLFALFRTSKTARAG